jgi:diguanylate cyclase (GGDEF)-like protein
MTGDRASVDLLRRAMALGAEHPRKSIRLAMEAEDAAEHGAPNPHTGNLERQLDIAPAAIAWQGIMLLAEGDVTAAWTCADRIDQQQQLTHRSAAVVTAFRAQLAFFAGSSLAALQDANLAIAHARADGANDIFLVVAREMCIVMGSLGESNLGDLVAERVERSAEHVWDHALALNDWATLLINTGQPEAAVECIDTADSLLLGREQCVLPSVVLSLTRAEALQAMGHHELCNGAAVLAVERMRSAQITNPYLLGWGALLLSSTMMDVGLLDEALQVAIQGVEMLGDRLPSMRAELLGRKAHLLRSLGQLEEAFEALDQRAALDQAAASQVADFQKNLERLVAERINAEQSMLELRHELEHDSLTGVFNRRKLASFRSQSWSQYAAVLVDVDQFKQVNDTFGHAFGDLVLRTTAELLVRHTEGLGSTVIRLGGDEFLVMVPEAQYDVVASAAEAFRSGLAKHQWPDVGAAVITASVGIAIGSNADSIDEVMRSADEHLYAAKRQRRMPRDAKPNKVHSMAMWSL